MKLVLEVFYDDLFVSAGRIADYIFEIEGIETVEIKESTNEA